MQILNEIVTNLDLIAILTLLVLVVQGFINKKIFKSSALEKLIWIYDRVSTDFKEINEKEQISESDERLLAEQIINHLDSLGILIKHNFIDELAAYDMLYVMVRDSRNRLKKHIKKEHKGFKYVFSRWNNYFWLLWLENKFKSNFLFVWMGLVFLLFLFI